MRMPRASALESVVCAVVMSLVAPGWPAATARPAGLRAEWLWSGSLDEIGLGQAGSVPTGSDPTGSDPTGPESSPAPRRWIPQDAKLLYRSNRMRLQARSWRVSGAGQLRLWGGATWHSRAAMPAAAVGDTGARTSISLGSISHRWGLGGIWPSGFSMDNAQETVAAASRRFLDVTSSVSRAIPRRVGGSLTWEGPGSGSGRGPCLFAVWGWRNAWGLALARGSGGFSLGQVDDRLGQAWVGSIVATLGRSPEESASGRDRTALVRAGPARVAVELAARRTTGNRTTGNRAGGEGVEREQRTRWGLGLGWTVPGSRTFGTWSGRLWTGPSEGLVHEKDADVGRFGTTLSPGWELAWEWPRRGALRGDFRVSVLHPSADAIGRAIEQRDTRLGLATLLGPGHWIELLVRHGETLAALPRDQRTVHESLGRRARTSLDLRLKWAQTPGWDAALRVLWTIGRRGSWGSAAEAQAAEAQAAEFWMPEGDGLYVDGPGADSTEPPAGSSRSGPLPDLGQAPGPWQTEDAQSMTAFTLRSFHRSPWCWGATGAITRADGFGSCYLPLRRPPGHVLWRGIGAGTYLLQIFAGRPVKTMTVEGTALILARPGRKPTEVQLSIGCRWHGWNRGSDRRRARER